MKRLVALLVICAAIIGAILGIFIVSTAGNETVIFGISDPELAQEDQSAQAADLIAMKSVGITSLRIEANWASVQRLGRDSYDWSRLDREIRAVHSAGMMIDLVVDGCPEWAAAFYKQGDLFSQPASSSQYASFALHVAERYRPMGVNTFEIWNEPNNASFWQPRPNAAAYTADLVAAYVAIKSVNGSAMIISGGLSPGPTYSTNVNPITFLNEMYADGARGKFDALGIHPYSFPATPDTYKTWSGWSQMTSTKPSLRSIMTNHGDDSKPIWITEFGAPTAGANNVGLSGQIVALSQAIGFTRKVSWLGALYIYTWRDTVPAVGKSFGFGLLTSNGQPKPALNEMRDLLR